MLSFQLYKKHRSNLLGYLVGTFIVVMVLSHFLFKNNTLNMVLVGGFCVIILYLNFFEKKTGSHGNVYMYNHMINLITPEENIQFNLSDAVRVKINYGGYKGKIMVGDFVPRYNSYSGDDNLLVIKFDERSFEYNFLVENVQEEEMLKELVNYWMDQNFNVHYNP